MMDNKRSFNILFYLAAIIAVVLFAFHNVIFAFNGDGLLYQLSFATHQKITSFSDIVQSQITHYHVMNGRIVPHFVAQCILPFSWGKTVFNILNTVIFALLLLVLNKLCVKNRIFPLFLVLLSLFYLLPGRTWEISFAMVSLNYLLPALLISVSLLLFEKYQNMQSCTPLGCIGLVLFGILCGCTHETFVVGISGAFFFYYLFNFKSIRKPAIFLVLGFWLGSIVLVASPGILGRASNEGVLAFDLKAKLVNAALVFYHLKLFWILCLLIVVSFTADKSKLYSLIRENAILLSAMLISLAFCLLFAKVYFTNDRAVYGVEFLSLILIIRFLPENENKFLRALSYLLIGFLFIHQFFVLDVSRDKWNEYKTNHQDYLASDTGLIVYNEHPSSKLIEPFTIDLDFNYYDGFGTHMASAEKEYKDALTWKDNLPFVALSSELVNCLKSPVSFETESNRVAGDCLFFTVPSINVIVAEKTDSLEAELASHSLWYVQAQPSHNDSRIPYLIQCVPSLSKILPNESEIKAYREIRLDGSDREFLIIPKPYYHSVAAIVEK